jgi:hypothetical protein
MHSIIQRWLASALFAGLVLAGASAAQPPGQKEGPPTGPAEPSPIGVDDIVKRIMAFDKDQKGKVTKADLPERMQFLIELGDTNKDGALNKDEIRKLATKLELGQGEFGFGGAIRLRTGRGPGPAVRRAFPVARQSGIAAVEGVVEDLKLSGKKKEQAMAAVQEHQENVRKLMDQARAQLLQKMKKILSEEELQDFKAALDRPRGEAGFPVGPRDSAKGDGQKNLDQPQK